MRLALLLLAIGLLQDVPLKKQFEEKRDALKGNTSPEAHCDLGDWCLTNTLKDEAKGCFQKAWELKEGFDRARAGMAKLQFDLENKLWRPVREIYEKRRKSTPPADLDARCQVAEYAHGFGLDKEWKHDLTEILKLDGEFKPARLALGFTHLYGKWLTVEEVEAEKKIDETWKALIESKSPADQIVSKLKELGVKVTLEEAKQALIFAASPREGRSDVKLEKEKATYPTGEYTFGIPESYKPWRRTPLIVFLHGGGAGVGDGDTYFPQIWPHSGPRGYLTICPTVLEKTDLAWDNPKHDDYIRAIIKEFATKYNVDEERTYLMGHSMGGFGCFWLGTRMTDLFAAISPWSGGPNGAVLSNLKLTPCYIIHSAKDPTVRVDGSREADKQLTGLKIYHVYVELTCDGHGVPGPDQEKSLDWLERFKLNPLAKSKKK